MILTHFHFAKIKRTNGLIESSKRQFGEILKENALISFSPITHHE